MVDATFFFVLVFGGLLVGFVTGAVRRHGPLRKSLNLIAGAAGGFAGTPLWLAFVQYVLPHVAPTSGPAAQSTASILSDLYWLSPILGGFLGVGLLALVARIVSGKPDDEPWLARLGDLMRIVGIVYLTVTILLTLALIWLAAPEGQWALVSPPTALIDILCGATLVLAGKALTRHALRTHVRA